MLTALNHLVDMVEEAADGGLAIKALAAEYGTTEYHLRRMFSSLAGMPLSEYVRRRRMSLAAADVVRVRRRPADHRGPSRLRLDRGVRARVPRRSRRQTRRCTPRRWPPSAVNNPAQVPPDRRREHPHGRPHRRPPRIPPGRPRRPCPARSTKASTRTSSLTCRCLPMAEHVRLKALSDAEPAGLLQITADLEPDGSGGQRADLHARSRPHGGHACPRRPRHHRGPRRDRGRSSASNGSHPQALQDTWAATAAEWFPSNPWRLRPGPSIVCVLERDDEFTTATCELWQPVERA